MDNDKETILKLFNSGATIKGLTEMLYSQAKAENMTRNKSEKIKVNQLDIKNMVEKTIYESQITRAK